MFPRWSDWNIAYTRKGKFKNAASSALQVLVAAAAIVGAYRARKSGQGLGYFRTLLQQSMAYVARLRN